jgi:putative membrane protein
MKRIGFLSLAVMVALSVGCSRKEASSSSSGSTGTVGTAGKTDVTNRDKDFVHDVAVLNTAEVELGRFALDHSTDSEVKKFAQMMVDDHTKAGDALKAVASQYNIDVPTQLEDKYQKLRDKLAKKQGLEFDREYMEEMEGSHRDLIAKLEPRIDQENLRSWKTEMADKLSGKVVVEQGALIAVKPEQSDNVVTMALNTWAAATYPIAQTHLTAAAVLHTALKKKSTH